MSQLAKEVREELQRRKEACLIETADAGIREAIVNVCNTISSYEDSDIENVASLIESDDYNEVCDSLIQSFGRDD